MKKDKVSLLIISLIVIASIIIVGTYAWFTWRSKETALVLVVGDIDNVQITLKPYKIDSEIIPVLTYEDEDYVNVSVTSSLSSSKKIKLYYHINNIDSELASEEFKYTITKSTNGGTTYNEYLTGNFLGVKNNDDFYIMEEEVSKSNQPLYRVYLWLNESGSDQSSFQGKSFSGELRAEIIPDTKPSVPELDDGMIPVVISDTGITKTISKDDTSWYNYKKKQWANMVLVNSSSRSKYLNTTGVTVNEDDILAYYVWIPRYKYKIWSVDNNNKKGKEQEIQIIFENKSDSKTLGTQIGEYRTHPAFTFGNTELNGIWVGKFETTGTADAPTIKPNVRSLINQKISAQFTTAQKLGTSTYGSTSKVDAHMMKNSEWGAVAYLSHSKYGVNREVYINNSGSTYTGRSGGNVGGSTAINTVYTDQTSTTQYNTYGFYTWDGYLLSYGTNNKTTTHDISKVASTTGNITGVYDMSGGALEYVMGVFANSDGTLWSGNATTYNSGFTGLVGSNGDSYTGVDFPDSKYYDVYKAANGTSINALTACDGGICYGHCLSEVNKWYGDYKYFVNASNPWFMRGGNYGNGANAGVFNIYHSDGGAHNPYGFRSVVSFVGA